MSPYAPASARNSLMLNGSPRINPPIRTLKAGVRKAKLDSPDADAVLAASVFHYGTLSIAEVKAGLAEAGFEVR